MRARLEIDRGRSDSLHVSSRWHDALPKVRPGGLQQAGALAEPSGAQRVPEEIVLVRSAAAGDEHAAVLLYQRHADLVYRTAARIVGAHDPDLDDIVQEVFLAAIQGGERFDGRSKVSTWIVGIATRRALDHTRARWRRDRWRRVRERVGLGRPALEPDRRLLACSEAEALLLSLSPDQRAVFVLCDVEGFALREVSEMTGAGISTLHARLKAARCKLHGLSARTLARSEAGDE